MASVRIAVMSEDRLYREGLLRLFLDAERSLAPGGSNGGGEPPAQPGEARPYTMLVDSRMDGALEFCASLKREGRAAVIFVAAPDDDEWELKALKAGACGVLTRSARAEDLVKAVHTVRAGNIWAGRRALAAYLDHPHAGRPSRPSRAAAGPGGRLSRREMDVFRYAAAGRSNKEVAEKLNISPATVKAHLSRIFQKLGLRSRAELAAAYHGVVGEAPPSSLAMSGPRLQTA